MRDVAPAPGPVSFDEFYSAKRQRVYDCVYALTSDAMDAQDAVQEAFARAWQRWSVIAGYDDPEAWVRTVARRIAVSRWRRARNRTVAHRRLGPPPDMPGPGPEGTALMAALARLPIEQRTALVLHHLCDLSVEDVARETGAPIGTVKARLSRGRRALSALLGVDVTEGSHV
jgi:RNA polymerase sigma-70 factor (ECF subfamily)